MNAHAMRVLLRRATLSFRHFDFRRALNTWLEYAIENGERMRRLHMAASELSGGRRRAAWATWLDFVDERRLLRRSASGLRKPSLLRALVDDDARVRELAATLLAASRRGLRPLPGRSLLDPRALTHGPHEGWIWARVPVQAPATALEAVHDGRRTSVVLPVPSLPPMDIAWLPVGDAAAVPSPLEIYQASQSWIDLK